MSFYIGSNKITPALLNQKSSGGIENTATAYESLTILGVPNTRSMSSVNIGINSEIISDSEYDGSTAVGCGAIADDYGTAIGSVDHSGDRTSAAEGGVAVGSGAAAGYGSIAIGGGSVAEYGSIALGNGATSTSDNSFDVAFDDGQYKYQLLDGTTGKIPNDRINGATGSFTSADGKTITVTNGVITSIV